MNNPSSNTARPLDARTFWIGVMCVIFTLLLVAHAVRPGSLMSEANAQEAVDTRDYTAVTAAQDDGSEALYVLDKRSGALALLLWDPQAQRPRTVAVQPVQNAFRR